MPRAGLGRTAVVDLGVRLADERGFEALTLAAVAAEAGVAVPSLYKHIGSLADLRAAVTLRGLEELAERSAAASVGVAGPAALRALAAAIRRFAAERPGLYSATQVAVPDDPTLAAAAARAVAIVEAVLAGFGLPEASQVDAVRAVRAAIHGFVVLERNGGFGLPEDPDDSFDALLAVLIAGLPTLAPS